jgi:hypothetical protein
MNSVADVLSVGGGTTGGGAAKDAVAGADAYVGLIAVNSSATTRLKRVMDGMIGF